MTVAQLFFAERKEDTCLILPSCLTKAAFTVCFMARLMEVCLRPENGAFASAPRRRSRSVYFIQLRMPAERSSAHSAGLHSLRSAQPRAHEKPIANILPRSRQRLPSNRSIRPAPRCLLPLTARLIARSSSDRVLTFYGQVDWIRKHWPTFLAVFKDRC